MENGEWKMEGGSDKTEKWSPVSPFPPSLVRFGLVFGLLLFALVASFLADRRTSQPMPAAGEPHSTEAGAAGKVHFVDTEGWYRITDNERAVVSPYLLSLDGLPESLPMKLGRWQARRLPLGPEVEQWFDNPEVALQREYSNAAGAIVWLSVFGSRGPKSFRLFEHTPATCYPLSGWKMTREDVDTIKIGNGQVRARRGFAAKGPHELIVLYLYVWDNPDRDPEDGVVSIRVSAPILTDETETLRLLKEEFLPNLFTEVVPWRRF